MCTCTMWSGVCVCACLCVPVYALHNMIINNQVGQTEFFQYTAVSALLKSVAVQSDIQYRNMKIIMYLIILQNGI